MKIKNLLILSALAIGICADMLAFRGGGSRGGGGRSMGGARSGGGRSLGGGRGGMGSGSRGSFGAMGRPGGLSRPGGGGFTGARPGGFGKPGYSRPSTGGAGFRPGGYGRPGYGKPGAGYAGWQRPSTLPAGRPGIRPGQPGAGRPGQIIRPGGGQRPGTLPAGRPGTRPGQPGAGRPGQGLRPADRPGRLDPNKTFRQDANRNPQRLNQQTNFMNRRFDARHDFNSLYRGNFPLYMGLFPFAFYRSYGYYPPIYYDYYDQNGVYPQEDPNYDAYASGEMPIDFEQPPMGPEQGYGPPPMGFDQGYGPGQYGPQGGYPPVDMSTFVDYAGEPQQDDQYWQQPNMAEEEQMGPMEVASALQGGEACLDSCSQDCLNACSNNPLLSADVCKKQCANICTQQCQGALPAA